jgi:hypothetical protein
MEIINYINLATGLLLVVVAWLVYRNPDMISPYGNMSPERKALVDIESLKKSLAITFAVTGILLVIVATLGMVHVIDEMTGIYAMIILSTAMLVPLFVAMWKYNGFGRKRRNEKD